MINNKKTLPKKGRLKVAVIMGGRSSEHNVSIHSGKNVVEGLDEKKYEIFPVIISKTGNKWLTTTKKELSVLPDHIESSDSSVQIVLSTKREISDVDSINKKGVDVAFIALHGPYGEDGTIQGMLDMAGIRYTGSGVLASAIGMDKIVFRKIMSAEGINIPKYLVVKRGENFKNIHKKLKRTPYFVKPFNQGSSVGASVVKKEKDLGKAIKLAHKFSDLALVDEFVKGKEVTCGVLGNNKPYALPLVEIVTKKDFFDYESKYSESGADEISPARVGKRITKKVQDLAIKVYRAVGCRGFARVDFILKNNLTPVVLEINTIPGLTQKSLLPKAAKAAGISYSNLLDEIIKHSLS